MTQNLFLASTHVGSSLTSVSLSLFRALENLGLRVGYFKPIRQTHDSHDLEPALEFLRHNTEHMIIDPIATELAEKYLSNNKTDDLMELIVERYDQISHNVDIVVIEGLNPDKSTSYVSRINKSIAQSLDSQVILVSSPLRYSAGELNAKLEIHTQLFGGLESERVLGVIFNKVNNPEQILSTEGEITAKQLKEICPIFKHEAFHLIGFINWQDHLTAPRTFDLQSYIGAEVINEGEIKSRRVERIILCARNIANIIQELTAHTLVVTAGDRDDVVIACSLAAQSGIPLAGIILTGDYRPHPKIMELIQNAMKTGLPIISTKQDTYTIAQELFARPDEIPPDDNERFEKVIGGICSGLDPAFLKDISSNFTETRLSPPAFRYRLALKAKEANKTIVLPEGEEERTIKAAIICHEKKIAKCILLGQEDNVRHVINSNNLTLPDDLQIIDPKTIKHHYIQPMVELRKHKKLSPPMAEAQLDDPIVVGTMMVTQGEVDGLVSGAINTTANTIRPALQLIRTHSDTPIVSSIFFMCLPEQVVVYGDCAVNPSPSAEELAHIAIQSADSAQQFGITPKVAMISYSTGSSGGGSDVDKVQDATNIAKRLRPDLIIDGPLQYDAAAIKEVARKKAPDSPVAGQATVFVFPDLNTGNTTYKAVQRSAKVVSIGPMLQGLRKPVNDLSRGALVDDIVYTIALTAIQSNHS
jgi:phosphate acetyltransferase